jgi:curved DNA-binding protein CbpA
MAFRTERASESDYGLLGLNGKASRKEVKSAYRRMAKEWHPDRFHQRSARDRELAEEKFKAFTAAYRRIAAGWLDDERPQDHQPGDDHRTPGSRWSARAQSYTQPKSRWQKAGSSTLMRPRSFLATGLLLAALASLFAIRAHFSAVDWKSPSKPALTLPEGAPSGGFREPEPRPEQTPGALPEPEEAHQEKDPPEPPRTQTLKPGQKSRHASDEHSTDFISIGSTQQDVLRIQGSPEVVRGQTWVYGVSELSFKEGRVVRYNNFDGSLRVRVLPSRAMPSPPPAFYTIGSSMDEVLAVQGTPTRMEGSRWLYGFSELRFKDGKLMEYDNFFGDLKIQLSPDKVGTGTQAERFFTVGSTTDEVLLAQGTPTSIKGNLWYYQMSSVVFRKGKVQYVFNSSANLRFVPKEELTRSE